MEPRVHIINLTVDAGITFNEDFNLSPGSRLVHASAAIGAAGPPIRVAISLIQPRVVATVFTLLVGGWMRGMGVTPFTSHNVVWDGDIPIGTDMAIRFQARNDTGADQSFSAFIVVVE